MRKVALVLFVVFAAVVGTATLATAAKTPKVCPPGSKPLYCASGRIVCCDKPNPFPCDCGPGLTVR